MMMYALKSLFLWYACIVCLMAIPAVNIDAPMLKPKMRLTMFISRSFGVSVLYHGGIKKPAMAGV
jgi:hypothetical protein